MTHSDPTGDLLAGVIAVVAVAAIIVLLAALFTAAVGPVVGTAWAFWTWGVASWKSWAVLGGAIAYYPIARAFIS